MSRRATLPAALLGAAAIGAVAAIALRGTPAPAAPRPSAMTTASVVRTDLSTTILTAATLGYAPTSPLINQMGGTYTSLPAVGATVSAGEALYRVDNRPIVLMTGPLPAWRTFAPGMADGPDVGQLESNLLALGDAAGLFGAPSDHFGPSTTVAVERWQRANGYPLTGQIPLGQVAFLPAAVLVGPHNVAPGQAAVPGDLPYAVTTSVRQVTVPLTPLDPAVALGQTVSIVLPSNASTPGKVIAIGPAPDGPSSGAGSGSGSGSGSSTSTPTVLTVAPDDPARTGNGSGIGVQVSLTVSRARHVLAVPVSALLALAGGGYGVEVAPSAGSHRLVGVTTGLFAGGRVQVSGRGITVGTRVVIAQ